MFKKYRFYLVLLVCMISVSSYGNDIITLNSGGEIEWQVFPVGKTVYVRVAKVGYEPEEYVPGIVPGTIFSAYVAAGKEEEPSYGDNIYNVDESKYNQAFWYRTTFKKPETNGRRVILVLEGTNRYGTVYLNGKKLKQIRGHVLMMRHDITDLLAEDNCLAVRIDMPSSSFLSRTSNFAD